jgi:diaminohydroxyphosphoribosylaminopyrimidine deaminase/5-amino-6-(5-phosphoribosylamino)uracil reductase
MAQAVALALNGRGKAAPNPCVGAVLTREGRIVARGWHTAYGAPHAEVECLADARRRGVDPAGATLFVTLEPCNHQGKTPPCTEAVLAAGIARVVVGAPDPNPDVPGGGAQYLRSRGVEVEVGVLEERCRDLIDDFVLLKRQDRTYNLLKMASTLDGKIAARGGRPEAVSSPESLACVHVLRSQVDAILVGSNTFFGDNPSLTCRPDLAPEALARGVFENLRQPRAVVVSTRLPKPVAIYNLLREDPARVIFWTTAASVDTPEAGFLRDRGCSVWSLPDKDGRFDLEPGFIRLRQELSCHLTMCEGGGGLAMTLVEQGLVDEFQLFLAPRIVGDGQAKCLFSGRNVRSLTEAIDYRVADMGRCGPDMLLTLKPRRV